MIATEAVEGVSRDHYFDEFRNREFIPPEPKRHIQQTTTSLEKYDIGLIRDPKTGNLRWRNGLHDNL